MKRTIKTAAEWNAAKGENLSLTFTTDSSLPYGSCELSYHHYEPPEPHSCCCHCTPCECTSDGQEPGDPPDMKINFNNMDAAQALTVMTEMKGVLDKAMSRIKALVQYDILPTEPGMQPDVKSASRRILEALAEEKVAGTTLEQDLAAMHDPTGRRALATPPSPLVGRGTPVGEMVGKLYSKHIGGLVPWGSTPATTVPTTPSVATGSASTGGLGVGISNIIKRLTAGR